MPTYLQNGILLWFIDLASKTAMSNGIVDYRLVRFGAWFLEQFWPCGDKQALAPVRGIGVFQSAG